MDTRTAPTLLELRQQRDELLKVFDRHGCSNIRVFGSVARGEATTDSDVDFLCDHDRTKRTPWFPAGLIVDLEKHLGTKVDVAFSSILESPILGPQIAEELVAL